MDEKPLVRFEVQDGIGVVTIDNPPVNALGPGVRDGIVEALEKGLADPSVKDGVVRVMIPGVGPEPEKENVPEGIATDARGNIYGAEVALKNVVKYSRN